MKRTAERVLSIISVIVNFLSLIFLMIYIFASQMILNDPLFEQEIENALNTPGMTQEEIEASMALTNTIMPFISSIGWFFVVVTIIAIILGIVGAVKVNKNSKSAGIMFIIAGVLSGILTLPGILLFIAAILCFVRKPKAPEHPIIESM